MERFNFILGQIESYQEDWKEKYCDSINKDHFGEEEQQSLAGIVEAWRPVNLLVQWTEHKVEGGWLQGDDKMEWDKPLIREHFRGSVGLAEMLSTGPDGKVQIITTPRFL